MKKHRQINKKSTADNAETEDKIQATRLITGRRLTFAVAALAGLALANGCATRNRADACYSPPPATAYAEPAPQPATAQPTEAQANIVVPLHQESVNVGKREVDAGSVRLKKVVRTETINQPIQLRREEVVIDRETGTGEASSNKKLAQPFQEEETVIPLKREEAVIERRTASAGQIVIRTRETTEQTNIQAQVRREDIDLAQLNNTPNVIIGQNVRSGVGGAETPGGTSTGAAKSSEQTEIITDPGTLPSDNAPTYGGRRVHFKNMKVQKVVGDRLIVVSTDNGRPLYVCSDQAVTAHPGETVVITGKIKQKGGKIAATGVDEKGAQLLMQQPYYIEVQKIEMAPQ